MTNAQLEVATQLCSAAEGGDFPRHERDVADEPTPARHETTRAQRAAPRVACPHTHRIVDSGYPLRRAAKQRNVRAQLAVRVRPPTRHDPVCRERAAMVRPIAVVGRERDADGVRHTRHGFGFRGGIEGVSPADGLAAAKRGADGSIRAGERHGVGDVGDAHRRHEHAVAAPRYPRREAARLSPANDVTIGLPRARERFSGDGQLFHVVHGDRGRRSARREARHLHADERTTQTRAQRRDAGGSRDGLLDDPVTTPAGDGAVVEPRAAAAQLDRRTPERDARDEMRGIPRLKAEDVAVRLATAGDAAQLDDVLRAPNAHRRGAEVCAPARDRAVGV